MNTVPQCLGKFCFIGDGDNPDPHVFNCNAVFISDMAVSHQYVHLIKTADVEAVFSSNFITGGYDDDGTCGLFNHCLVDDGFLQKRTGDSTGKANPSDADNALGGIIASEYIYGVRTGEAAAPRKDLTSSHQQDCVWIDIS